MPSLTVTVAAAITTTSTIPTPNRHSPTPHHLPRRPRPPLLSSTRRPLLSSSSPSTLLYYASLASSLASSGRFRDFLMLAESALAADALGDSPSLFVARIDTRLVSRGVSEVLRQGDNLGQVMEFLRGAESLGIRAVTLIDQGALEALKMECLRLAQAGRMEEFVEVMETLSGYQFQIKKTIDPMDILRIFVEKQHPIMAVRYASLHSHSQFLFCFIIEEFGKKKDLASALKAFEAFRNKSGGFNMFAYRSIIDICGLCGDSSRSREIFKALRFVHPLEPAPQSEGLFLPKERYLRTLNNIIKIKPEHQQQFLERLVQTPVLKMKSELLSQKIVPNVFVYNSLMNVNSHDLNYTLYVYKHMRMVGIQADVTSYNILLKACCLAKRVDLVQDIYKELKQAKSLTSLQLDVITYSTMIKAFSDAKKLQSALNIKQDMTVAGVHPNVITWSSLIAACANAGFIDKAMQIFEEMLLSGCEPNSRCWNSLLYACVRSCQYDRAFRLFNTWKVSGFEVFGVSTKVISSRKSRQSPIGNLPNSGVDYNCNKHSVIKNVPFKPTVATYNILMKACGGDYYRAKHLIDEMKLMGLSPNHISWSTLIDVCGSTQNVKGAMQAFKAMQEDGVRPDVIAYTAAIKVCVGSKHLKIAFSLFEEMKRQKLQPNMVTYNTLLRARNKYGSLQEVQQCLSIYLHMRKSGFNSNDYYLKELLEEWCEGVLSSGIEKQETVSLTVSHGESYMNDSQNLLEMVADHLQRDIGVSRVIDVRGLSKVEARIVVLSVLRMIKENHFSGHTVMDDMVIITATSDQDGMGSSCSEHDVQQTIISILRDNLGLEVSVGSGVMPSENVSTAPSVVSSDLIVLQKSDFSDMVLARRPECLGIIRVSRTSLCNWLQRKGKH